LNWEIGCKYFASNFSDAIPVDNWLDRSPFSIALFDRTNTGAIGERPVEDWQMIGKSKRQLATIAVLLFQIRFELG
jgi:hypothetical protein